MKRFSLFPIVGLLFVVAFGANVQSTSVEKAAALTSALDGAIKEYQKGVDDGIYLEIPDNASLYTPLVNLPGNVNLTLGLVTLPLDFLCRQPSTLSTVVCYVCSYDCTFVHNKYGGQCGTAVNPMPGTPQETGEVCVCNDSLPPNVANFTNLEATCGTLVDPVLVDPVVELAVAVALRQRMFAVQCIPDLLGNPLLGNVNSVGCNSDCTTNHNYRNGTCQLDPPVATFLTETYPGYNCFCA